MSDCCCSSSSCSTNTPPRKSRCPVNGKEYAQVSPVTIKHHIKHPWEWVGKDQGYYFCDDPECDVVYFAEDSTVFNKSDLRTTVGVKEHNEDRLICYCYGVTMKQASTNNDIKPFVIQETKEHTCACETRNPSGKCCLKDFP